MLRIGLICACVSLLACLSSSGDGGLARGTDLDLDFTFDGAIGGTLGQGGYSYIIDGALVGEFRGRDQDGITGLIYGDISGPNEQDLFDGTLAATRND